MKKYLYLSSYSFFLNNIIFDANLIQRVRCYSKIVNSKFFYILIIYIPKANLSLNKQFEKEKKQNKSIWSQKNSSDSKMISRQSIQSTILKGGKISEKKFCSVLSERPFHSTSHSSLSTFNLRPSTFHFEAEIIFDKQRIGRRRPLAKNVQKLSQKGL